MASRRKNGSAAEDKPAAKQAKISDEEDVLGPYAHIDVLLPDNEGEEQPQKLNGLSWRQDPDQSLSDFSVIIQDMAGPLTTYCVHKCILGGGPNKSDYFHNVFHGGLAESLTSTITISLEGPAAKAFPSLLDYMYQIHTPVFTCNNAVPLRHLAQYFGIQNLFVDATAYIKQKCLSAYPSVWGCLLRQASLFSDEAVLSCLVDKYASTLSNLQFSDLAPLSPSFIVRVFSSTKCRHQFPPSSTIVTKLCDHYANENQLNWQTFKVLMGDRAFRTIDQNSALPLLKHCMSLKSEAEADVESWKALHDQCMRACTRRWKNLLSTPLSSCDETERATKLQHRQLPLETQVLLLENALVEAGASDVAGAPEGIREPLESHSSDDAPLAAMRYRPRGSPRRQLRRPRVMPRGIIDSSDEEESLLRPPRRLRRGRYQRR